MLDPVSLTAHHGALRSYCNGVNYLTASREGAVRVDLAGEPAGTVTGAEAEHAMEAIAVLAKVAAKRASEAARTPRGAQTAKGGRLSLQDLLRSRRLGKLPLNPRKRKYRASSRASAVGHFRTHAVQQKRLFPRSRSPDQRAFEQSRGLAPQQSASSRSPAKMHGNPTVRITSDAAFSHSQGQKRRNAVDTRLR
jgi:sRNA-binding protein